MRIGTRIGGALLALALGAGSPVARAQEPADPASPAALRAAEALQAQGKLAEAAQRFRKAAEQHPDDWTLWDRAGWAHLDAGEVEPALSAFEAARRAAPKTTPVGGLLIAQFAAGKLAEASETLRREYPPEVAEAALPLLRKGLAARPFEPDWSYALGYLLARVVRNAARALAPLEAVCRADPKRAEAWLLLMEVNRELGRAEHEDAAALRYLELAPESAEAFRLRAQRLAAAQQTAEAVAEYSAGIAKHPTAAELYYGLARLHERQGEFPQAEALYRKLIAAASARRSAALEAKARAQLAAFQIRRGQYAEAARYYEEAARSPDASAATWSTWGALLALLGRWEPAARALEGAAERLARADSGAEDPHRLFLARYQAAVCRLAAGQRAEAAARLQAALAPAAPKDAGAAEAERTAPEIEAAAFLVWLSGSTAKLERLEYRRSDERWAAFAWRRQPEEGEALLPGRSSPVAAGWRAILEEVVRKQPDCWPAHYALARIEAAAGATNAALERLRRCAELRVDWWAPHYALGHHYAVRRDAARGIPALRRALQFAPECRQARVYLALLQNLPPEEPSP